MNVGWEAQFFMSWKEKISTWSKKIFSYILSSNRDQQCIFREKKWMTVLFLVADLITYIFIPREEKKKQKTNCWNRFGSKSDFDSASEIVLGRCSIQNNGMEHENGQALK